MLSTSWGGTRGLKFESAHMDGVGVLLRVILCFAKKEREKNISVASHIVQVQHWTELDFGTCSCCCYKIVYNRKKLQTVIVVI